MDRNSRHSVVPAQAGVQKASAAAIPATAGIQKVPGASAPDGAALPTCHPLDGSHCATCADEGIEALVLAVRDDSTAEVEMEGRTADVAIDLLEGVRAGDRLLIHAGVAIARVELNGAARGDDALDPRLRWDDGAGLGEDRDGRGGDGEERHG